MGFMHSILGMIVFYALSVINNNHVLNPMNEPLIHTFAYKNELN